MDWCPCGAVLNGPAMPRSASLAPAILVRRRDWKNMFKLCADKDIRSRSVPSFIAWTLPTVVRLQQRWWGVIRVATGLAQHERRTLRVALFRAFKNAHQHSGASVQTIKRRLEHLARLFPRVSDRATLVEPRIEIAGNHNSCAIYREPRRDLARLIRIHHDDEIGAGDGRWRERSRAISR